MPSAFAVLAETPAKRRARRAALLKARAAAESTLSTPDDLLLEEEEADVNAQAKEAAATLAEEAEMAEADWSGPRVGFSDEKRRAFKESSRRNQQQLDRMAAEEAKARGAAGAASSSSGAPNFLGSMGGMLSLWAEDNKDKSTEQPLDVSDPRSGRAKTFGTGGGSNKNKAASSPQRKGSVTDMIAEQLNPKRKDSIVGGVLTAAQSVGDLTNAVQSFATEALTDAGKQEIVIQAMRNLPMRHAINSWVNAIAERRERARKFKKANAEGVNKWLILWRVRPRWIVWCKHTAGACRHSAFISSLPMHAPSTPTQHSLSLSPLYRHAPDEGVHQSHEELRPAYGPLRLPRARGRGRTTPRPRTIRSGMDGAKPTRDA